MVKFNLAKLPVRCRLKWGSVNYLVSRKTRSPAGSNFNTGGQLPGGVACDNATHNFTVGVLADNAGAAFSNGQSIVTVSVTVCALQGFSQTDCVNTTVGPRVISQADD